MNARPFRAYLWMLGGSLSFATMGALSRELFLASLDWRLLALVRAALMLVFAASIAVPLRTPILLRASPTLWMRSIVGSIGMMLTFYTLTHLPFSEATTLIKSYPLWVAVLMWVVLKERPGARVWIAVGLGVAGVILIAQPHFNEARIALIIGVLSSICTAVVMLGLNRLAHLDARSIVIHFAMTATVISGAIFAASGRTGGLGPALGLKNLGLLLAMGLAGTLGQIAMTRAFALGDASTVSVVGLTELIFAVAYDRLLWSRSFGWVTIAGMALVAAPTAWLLASGRRSQPGSSGLPGSVGPATSP